MWIRAKVFLLLLAGIGLTRNVCGSELSFSIYGGLGKTGAGDLSRSLSSWRAYYQGRQGDGFSSSYDLGDMRGTAELGAEAVWTLSRRWKLSLGVGYVRQQTSGEITTQTTRHEEVVVSPSERWTVDFEQTTEQSPVYTKTTVPITLSLDYSFTLSRRWALIVGGGGGIYLGRLVLLESYDVQSQSISEQPTGNGVVQFIDRLSTVGDYSEKTKNTGFGLHGRVGLEFMLRSSAFLSITVVGRWVDAKGWKGTRHDASEWQWTYGVWGANSADGTDDRTEDGQYWTHDLRDEKTGKSYPVMLFRDAKPSASSRPANLDLSGVSIRVGLRYRFGGGD